MLFTSLVLVLVGCEGVPPGVDEPIRVRGATFKEGPLPYDDGAATPTIAYAASAGFIISQGQSSIKFSGGASDDAYSVAVGFPDAGDGYWVVPAGAPDPTYAGILLFSLLVDFARDVPYGVHPLALAAIDGEGNPGPRYDASLCILPDYANGNLGSCEESILPQDTILSLSWDAPVDLDLVVVTPDGKTVNPKAPTTANVETPIPSDVLNDPTTGTLSRDSNADCRIDGLNLESLIFPGEPPAGDYLIYADLYSACGQEHVDFALTLHQRVDASDGTWSVDSETLAQGQLLGTQADRGTALGTYLTTLSLP